MPQTLDDVAAGLYALKPEEFTAARNAAAAAADRPIADAIRRLKKPSVAAWAVNRLVRERPGELRQVLALAAELREAQQDLDAPALSKLNRERRTLTTALAREAGSLGADAGIAVSKAALDEVANTLNAAMMDAAAADAVMSGRLVRTLEAVGFGEVDLDGAVAGGVEPRAATAATAATTTDELAERRARKAAERAAREAAHTAAEAQRELGGITAKLAKVGERLERLRERRAGLEAELARIDADAADVEAELARLTPEHDAAVRAAASAARAAEAAQREADG